VAASVLVLFAHPSFEHSRVQRRLMREPRRIGATVRDLYELYPDFDIDVQAEQDALLAHPNVVFQHPVFWYSVPPLVRQWQDLVLEHGWAYGRGGDALEGKRVMHMASAGGPESAYRPDGPNRHAMAEFMRPLEQTARLCRMLWEQPQVAYGTHRMTDTQLETEAQRYRARLEDLAGRSAR
jgi:glutathione-regulated potassium-efflux system ancillary protein KefG